MVGPNLSRTINMVIKTSISQVLLLVEQLMQRSRSVYYIDIFLQDYQYTSREHCILSPTLSRTINTMIKTGVT